MIEHDKNLNLLEQEKQKYSILQKKVLNLENNNSNQTKEIEEKEILINQLRINIKKINENIACLKQNEKQVKY